MTTMHVQHIRRCLELAERGRGKVSPNPLVGCVVVDARGNVIAEGWHEEFGKEHAEAIAIQQVTKGELASNDVTLYVNLEPCCHAGKQPPCTDAIIGAGIKRAVFGARDPSNGGAVILKNAGIEVIGPILESECRRLNRGFFSLTENGRPWVTLKKAMRRNGGTDGKITSQKQDTWSHMRLRATHDAILAGSGTIIADDPRLTVRSPNPNPLPNPRRVILDPNAEIPPTATVLTDENRDRTLVIREKLPIPDLLQRLKEEGIASLLVEGGPKVWQSFEKSRCIDEIVILVGSP